MRTLRGHQAEGSRGLSTGDSARRHWRLRGACRTEDPELFFPKRVDSPNTAKAKAVCQTCPVMDECLAWGVETGIQYGVWGGTSPADRREQGIGKQPLRTNTKLIRCGTTTAYDRHIRLGEIPDAMCKEANRLRKAESRRKAKELEQENAG